MTRMVKESPLGYLSWGLSVVIYYTVKLRQHTLLWVSFKWGRWLRGSKRPRVIWCLAHLQEGKLSWAPCQTGAGKAECTQRESMTPRVKESLLLTFPEALPQVQPAPGCTLLGLHSFIKKSKLHPLFLHDFWNIDAKLSQHYHLTP